MTRKIAFAAALMATCGIACPSIGWAAPNGPVDSTIVSGWGSTYTAHTSCAAPNTINTTTGACGLPVSTPTIGGTSGGSGVNIASILQQINTNAGTLQSAVLNFADYYFGYVSAFSGVGSQNESLRNAIWYNNGLQAASVKEQEMAQQYANTNPVLSNFYAQNAANDAVAYDFSTGVKQSIPNLIVQGQESVQEDTTNAPVYLNLYQGSRGNIISTLNLQTALASESGSGPLVNQITQAQTVLLAGLNNLTASIDSFSQNYDQAVLQVISLQAQEFSRIVVVHSTGDYSTFTPILQQLDAQQLQLKAEINNINFAAFEAQYRQQAVTLVTNYLQQLGTITSAYTTATVAYNTQSQVFQTALGAYDTDITSGAAPTKLQGDYQTVITALTLLNTYGSQIGVSTIPISSIPTPPTTAS